MITWMNAIHCIVLHLKGIVLENAFSLAIIDEAWACGMASDASS
jgi:hypothetical protein